MSANDPVADIGACNDKAPVRKLLASAVFGCILTIVCWNVATLLSFGWMAADCFGGREHGCPTDHERNMAVVKTAVGAASVNIAGILLIGYIYARCRQP